MNALLTLRYRRAGEHYQRVADSMHGDAGLEGFGSDGFAYQAYCDVATTKESERTRKQKRKITTDLGKLKKNSEFWEATFQGLTIKRWVLVVPYFSDKEVLKHGREKAAELRQLGLPFLHEEFEFAISTDDDFPLALRELAGSGVSELPIDSLEIDSEGLEGYSAKFPEEFKTIQNKLEEGGLSDLDDKLVFQFVEWLLRRDHALERLREIDPDLRSKIDERRLTLARKVTTTSLYSSQKSEDRIDSLLDEIKHEFLSILPGLRSSTLEELAFGQIAEWLAECPLRFRGKN